MSVTTSESRIGYMGDGVTVNFAFPYLFQNNADIEVWIDDEQVTSGFTTTGASNAALPTVGGNVAFVTAPAIASTVELIRNPTTLQNTVIAPNDPFPAKTVETMVDAAMLAIQRLFDILSLQPDQNQLPVALSYPFQERTLSGTIPPAAARALSVLGFDVNGLPIAVPLPAAVGAGNMTAELGSNGKPGFKEGIDFAAGAPSILNLSQAYGFVANVLACWDGAYQEKDSYVIVGNQIRFGSWAGSVFNVGTWPFGIANVDVVGGTTLSVGTPEGDALMYSNTSGQSIPNNAETGLTNWTPVCDRLGVNFNAALGAFQAPTQGFYEVSASITFSGFTQLNTVYSISIVLNGPGGSTIIASGQTLTESISVGDRQVSVSAIVNIPQGQSIGFAAFQNSGEAASIAGSSAVNFLSISRIP